MAGVTACQDAQSNQEWPQPRMCLCQPRLPLATGGTKSSTTEHTRGGEHGTAAILGLEDHPLLRDDKNKSSLPKAILHEDNWSWYSFRPPRVNIRQQWRAVQMAVRTAVSVKEAFVKNISILHLLNHMQNNQETADKPQAFYSFPCLGQSVHRLESLFQGTPEASLAFNSCGELHI